MQVQGQWQPQWQPFVDAFAANFAQGEEGAGAALCYRGELVAHIWAGQCVNKLADITPQPWQSSTLVNVFSAGKGLVALCVLQLVAEGKLALEQPVAELWPEFAQAGKGHITLRHLLSHCSGLSAFHSPIASEQIFDWQAMTAAVAAESPWWPADEGQGYSPFIYGWLLGELVRRASGYASFNDYLQARVAAPLAVNCHVGVPDSLLHCIADTGPLKRPAGLPAQSNGADSLALGKIMKADPRGVTNRAFANPISLMTATNARAWRQAQIPAANLHTNAEALARIYGALANAGGGLLDNAYLPLCWQQKTFEVDRVLGLPLRFSHGFMLSQAQRPDCRYGRGARGFGHPGAGGSLGFADPDYQLGFGYVTSRLGQGLLIDERAVRLVDAAYSVVELNL